VKGRTVDVVIAASCYAAGLLLFGVGHGADPVLLVPLTVCCAALLLRRTAPPVSLLLGTAAVAADLALGPTLATPLVYTQVLYDASVHGRPRLARLLLAGSVLGSVVTGAVCLVLYRDERGISIAVAVALITVVPVLTGHQVRHHRDQAAAARRSALQVARLAEADRRGAVAAERASMARELHDVIANHLSAVAIHATAALSADLGADGTRRALTVIRENSVRGLAEMRQMIGLLRDATPGAGRDDDLARSGLAALGDLVGRAARAGLTVALTERGERGELPVSVDLAAYRIVQESLTNALKHGNGGPVALSLGYTPAAVDIRVSSALDGGRRPHGAGIGSGTGVIGMRERAALLGGSLHAGPDGDRWLVAARLPLDMVADAG